MILNSARVPSLCARPAKTHSTACTAYTIALKTMNMGLNEAVGRLRACNHDTAQNMLQTIGCSKYSFKAKDCCGDADLVVNLRPE